MKEIAEPAGALIQAAKFQLGDPTLSVLELWGAEYQESNAVLIRPGDQDLVQRIADRERCPVNFVGTITGDGRVRRTACIKVIYFYSFRVRMRLIKVCDEG